ncbi:MAG TPA: hypothetical protein VFM99_00185 [Chitinophagales bacterium]|nr:hypothetical protein [Chitinophagales bacterium]
MASVKTFLVFKNSEMIRLSKGISTDEVRKLLGKDYAVESCSDKNSEKWIYDFPGSNGVYKLYFRNKQLEWALNGTNFINGNTIRKLRQTQTRKKGKFSEA